MSETIAATLDRVAATLAASGFDEARRRARRLVAAALCLSPAELFGHPERRVGALQQERIADVLRRAVAREPLSRILGTREFWGLEFKVTPAVLVPRPETEFIIEEALPLLRALKNPRVADIGTGSGCLGVALAHEIPDAAVVASDLSSDALEVAKANAAANGVVLFTQSEAESGG